MRQVTQIPLPFPPAESGPEWSPETQAMLRELLAALLLEVVVSEEERDDNAN